MNWLTLAYNPSSHAVKRSLCVDPESLREEARRSSAEHWLAKLGSCGVLILICVLILAMSFEAAMNSLWFLSTGNSLFKCPQSNVLSCLGNEWYGNACGVKYYHPWIRILPIWSLRLHSQPNIILGVYVDGFRVSGPTDRNQLTRCRPHKSSESRISILSSAS